MLDLTIPHTDISMYKTDTSTYPRYELPEGFSFSFYRPGDELWWARLEVELAQFKTLERAIGCFREEFLVGQKLKPEDRMLFVRDNHGEIVATATLWEGLYNGKVEPRIHWVATSDRCAGRGIAKALLTRLFDLYGELGYSGFIYLWTGTRSYPAIAIYRKFGFVEFRGTKNPLGHSSPDFEKQNEAAIALVDSLIEKHRPKK